MRWPTLRRAREPGAPPSEPKEEGRGSLVRFILTLAVLAWILRSFIIAPFNIPSGSMLPTLYIGDYVMVAKWPYGYSRYSFLFGFPSFKGRIFAGLPRRGDVVVFRHPTEDIDLIKRVIGLPGDTIEVRDGELVLNGTRLARRDLPFFEMPISPNSPCKVVPPASAMVVAASDGRPACLYPAYLETLPGGPSYTVLDQTDTAADDFPPARVPPGHVFLMGDNRDDSLDSRFATPRGIGMVPVENLVGRGLVTFWSTDGSSSYWKPWTWLSALRGNRIGNGYTGRPAQ